MTWIITRSGRHFDYANPTPEAIHLPDIVHALSNNCRFNGHVKSFFSVAQHSAEGAIYAYQNYPLEIRDDVARAFLHHDFHEAYLSDFPTPLKMIIGDVLKPVEVAVDKAIFERFGVTKLMESYKKQVKEIDRIMLWSDAIRWKTDGVYTDEAGVEVASERVWVPEDFEVPEGLPETAMPPFMAHEYLSKTLCYLGGYTVEQVMLGA